MPIRTDVVYWPTFQPLADKAALRNQTEMRSVSPPTTPISQSAGSSRYQSRSGPSRQAPSD